MPPLAAPLPPLAGALLIAATVALCLWRADRALPTAARAPVVRRLAAGEAPDAGETRALAAALLAAGPAAPRLGALLAHLVRSALGCLAVAAILWATAGPGLPDGFLAAPGSTGRLLGTLGLSGLVTVLVVGWAAAAVIAPLAPRIVRAGPPGVAVFLLLDLGVRLAVLVAVTLASFALYARGAGSFGGSWQTALAAVPETLAAALRMQGLSGIYVWAALLGGWPLALVLIARLAAGRPATARLWRMLSRSLPLQGRPVRGLGIILGLCTGAAALVAVLALGRAG